MTESIASQSNHVVPGKFIRMKFITRSIVQSMPNTLFVMSDNMKRTGVRKGAGQAAEMRGEPNVVGVPTKWYPSMAPSAFFNDNDWSTDSAVRNAVVSALDRLDNALARGIDVVVPEDGVGTGRALLKEKAPFIFGYISSRLEELERKYR